jgi:hypothetical protein
VGIRLYGCCLSFTQGWFGESAKEIRPYRLLKPFDLDNKSDVQNLSRAKLVIDKLISGKVDLVQRFVSHQVTIQESDNIFTELYVAFFKRLFIDATDDDFDRRRFGAVNYITVYDKIVK